MEKDMQVFVFEATSCTEIEPIKNILDERGVSYSVQEMEDSDILKLKVNILDEQRAFKWIDKYLENVAKKSYIFRKAIKEDIEGIWQILQNAIERRKEDGSEQWQNGYPNRKVVESDIEKGFGYVLEDGVEVLGYIAITDKDDAYSEINGNWLSKNKEYIALHRVAVSPKVLGKGLAQEILKRAEQYAIDNDIHSIKMDTNFDNLSMAAILGKLGYLYCGEVCRNGEMRIAFEKRL